VFHFILSIFKNPTSGCQNDKTCHPTPSIKLKSHNVLRPSIVSARWAGPASLRSVTLNCSRDDPACVCLSSECHTAVALSVTHSISRDELVLVLSTCLSVNVLLNALLGIQYTCNLYAHSAANAHYITLSFTYTWCLSAQFQVVSSFNGIAGLCFM